jgi:hypothetical protein
MLHFCKSFPVGQAIYEGKKKTNRSFLFSTGPVLL